MKSVRTQLTVFAAGLGLIVSLAFGFGGYLLSSQALVESAEEALTEMAVTTGMLTALQLDQMVETLTTLAARRILTDGTPFHEVARDFQAEAERLGYEAFGIVDLTGHNRRTDGTNSDVRDREYFQQAARGEANISDVLISRVTGEPIMVAAVPITRNGTVEGVFLGIRDTDVLNRIVDNVGLGERGYSFVLNDQGTLIGHRDRALVRDQRNFIAEAAVDAQYEELAVVMRRSIRGETGVGSYWFQGSNRIMGYAPIGETGWSVMVGSFYDDVMQPVYRMRLVFLLLGFGGVLLGLLLAFVFSGRIAGPIVALTGIIGKVAQLDLRTSDHEQTERYTARKDELGVMSRAVNDMQEALKDITGTLNEVSQKVAASSQTLSASAEENSATIEEVASSVSEFSQTVGNTRDEAEAMRSDAGEIGNLATQGTEQMQATRESMDSIVSASGEVKSSLHELSSQAGRMESILKIIADIAEQTNLLALNAAIEAARAGEHGRGFAVVADEVRSLAEQTQQSVSSISEMIDQLMQNASRSVEIMDSSEEETRKGSDLLASTQESFTAIAQRINDTIHRIEAMSDSMRTVNETSDSIAAASEEQAASMEEIASMTESLAGMGDELRGVVSRFRL